MASAVKALQQYLHSTPKRELRKRLKNDIYFFCNVLLGREFHEAQKKIIDAVVSEEYDIITAACGRRFGKSEAMNSILEFWCITKKRRDYAVIAPTYDQSKIIFTKMVRDFETNPLLSDFIGKIKMIKPKTKKKEKEKKGITLNPYPKIEFINGSTIVFRSAERPDNLRGWSYHAVILDEAAFIDDNVVRDVIEPMLMDYGGQLIKISTPFGKSNHFYESFIKGLNSVGEYISFKFPSWVNPYIDKKWLERKKRDLGETNHTWLQEYCAEFLDDINTVFNLDSIMSCVAEIELMSEGLPGRRYAMGVDLAKDTDYTVITILDITEKPYELVYFDRFNRMPYKYVTKKVRELYERFNRPKILIDQTGVGNAVIEDVEDIAEGFKFSNESKLNLISELMMALDHNKIRYPYIAEMITELKYFRYVRTKTTYRMEAPHGMHDDCVISLALAVYAAENQPNILFDHISV